MPFLIASSIPSKVFCKFPKRVISLNFFSMIVSSDTLILLIPFFFKSLAYLFNKLPLVVRVISFKLVDDFFLLRFWIR